MTTNSVKEQDRARDLYCTWKKYGYVMFPQQKSIYSYLRAKLQSGSVLEAGCGSGQGQAIMAQTRYHILCTDKLESNVAFCRELYPQADFSVWDIEQPWHGGKYHSVVCVEVLEHVEDWRKALGNLLDACTHELWLSTPNGTGKPQPPANPYHVRELTPLEIINAVFDLEPGCHVEVLGWEYFDSVGVDTLVDPLVYKVTKA